MKTMSRIYFLNLGIIVLLVFFAAGLAKANETYLHYDTTTAPSICGDRISSIFYDEMNNRVLIATGYFGGLPYWGPEESHASGICILYRSTNTVVTYNTSNSAVPTNIYKSLTYGDDLIIGGSYSFGIVVINERTGGIKVYNKDTIPALKTNIYTGQTAPISSIKYENGKIYFAYGEFTERGLCGGVIDLNTNSVRHYYHYFTTQPGWPYVYREPSSLTIIETKIYFADRYITAFDKNSGQVLYHREDNANTIDWAPDERFIAYDSVANRLYVGDTHGWRFRDNYGLRIYDGSLNYIGHWDDQPQSPVRMLEKNVRAMYIDVNKRKLYIAHSQPVRPLIADISATIGNLQVVDLDKVEVIKNYVSETENWYDSWIPTPIKVLPQWKRAWFGWTNIIQSIDIDSKEWIYLGQYSSNLQSSGDGGGLGIIFISDSDGDGINDVDDNCPDIFNPDQTDNDSDHIGDICDPDDDNDSVPDTSDNCQFIANPAQDDNDKDNTGDACDDDDDNDSVPDTNDNCPFVANPDQSNIDGDSLGDVCDDDPDGDGILAGDNCPYHPNPLQEDNDGDRKGDICDDDDDNDGVLDTADNCPTVANPDQSDLDKDNIGDACDIDIDGDGVENDIDNCLLVANIGQEDTDHDGYGDACDTDDDNDGVLDADDNCPLIVNTDQSDIDGDGKGDVCDEDLDGDGISNDVDNCKYIANSNQYDWNNDSEGDACDADVDGDGVLNDPDICEFTPLGVVVDPSNGCSIDQLCPCAGPMGTTITWKNHGQFVSCVAKSSESFLIKGMITAPEKDAIVSAAANSICGQK